MSLPNAPKPSCEHVLASIQQLVDTRPSMEMCAECGAMSPPGMHEEVDLDGNVYPACQGRERVNQGLWAFRDLYLQEDENPMKKRARGYSVK